MSNAAGSVEGCTSPIRSTADLVDRLLRPHDDVAPFVAAIDSSMRFDNVVKIEDPVVYDGKGAFLDEIEQQLCILRCSGAVPVMTLPWVRIVPRSATARRATPSW